MPALLIDAEDVTVRFGQRHVLHSIAFTVHAGEQIAIVGPSGSGKTTLLSILGGLRQPTSGAVRHHGGAAGMVAWVLQTTNAFGSRSVVDNASLGAVVDGAGRGEAKSLALLWLDRLGLADVATQPARTLSGGELQRLSIARALASSRPVVIADEPTGQLDATTSRTVGTVLADSGVTLIVATHDPELAGRCGRQVTISDGRLFNRRP